MRTDPKDPDDELFFAAVEGATPLTDRERVRASQADHPPSQRRPTAHEFTIERLGDRVEGRSHGVSREQLSALRSGDIRPEATLDLHRLQSNDAARKLERFISGAAAAEHHCVLVIHGRGLHSEAGPVLPDRVIKVLSAGPTAPHVRAFCSAAGRDGGVGAMYVLVKPR